MASSETTQPDAQSKGLSPAVVTAIVGGVVTIVSVALQFVVAPMLTKNTVAADVQTTSAQMQIEAPHATARLARAIPVEPLTIATIDRSIVTVLGVRRLSVTDVQDLNCWQLRVLRNASPAFHGHRYKDVALDQLFRAQPWYSPRREAPLSATELANVSFIRGIEDERHCSAGGT
ncbi:MAG TPA: YARHG domain-containing protein [Thermoanaerobaculia bacterium]|nr:YARHG domain-containing protein [Thermoanaerobaculia bacterium]